MEKHPKNQKMSTVGFIALLGLLSSSPPLATDLFLPALPDMPGELGEPVSVINLIITVYFFMQAVGMLTFGPISDRFGRKNPLLVALALFIGGAIVTALAPNAWVAIGARVFQGLGGGGMVSIATALVKDCFEGETRQNALVAIQAIGAIAPMVAPILGSAILMVMDWRGTFLAQAVFALVALVFFPRMVEPLAPEDRAEGNPLRCFVGLVHVTKNGLFMALLLAGAMSMVPMMAYVTSASYTYIDFYGTTTFVYSLFFAANAVMSIVSTAAVPFLLKVTSWKSLMTIALAGYLAMSAILLFAAPFSPFVFLGAVIIGSFSCSVVRPVSVNALMDLHSGDTGSAAAMINCVNTLFGCFGSLLISLPWTNFVWGLGWIALGSGVIGLLIWAFVRGKVQ